MKRLPIAVALLLLALPLPAAEVTPPPASQRWITLEQDGLTFISNATPWRTQEIAYGIVGLRKAIQDVVGPARFVVPVRVFIFADKRALARYREAILRQKSTDTGIDVRQMEGTFIVLQSEDPAGISPFILHRLAHELIDRVHPSLPLWFREGLAEYFSSYRVTARMPQLGGSIHQHWVRLRSETWIEPKALFALDVDSPLYNERTREGMFFAESWLFVNAIMKDPALRAHVSRFIALTDQGIGATAFSRSFDLAPEDLQAKAKERLRGPENAKRVLSLKPEFERLTELPRPTAMARDRVLFELGYLLAVSLPGNAPVAEQFVTEALQVDPSNARAQALAGRLREQAGDHDAATKACERALSIGGDDSEVMLLCAEGVVRRLADHQEVPLPDVLHARALFEKATRLDPDSPRPWAGLGATYVTTADDPTRGIQALRRALALDPTSEHAPFLLAELLARNPDGMEEAKELGEASLKRSKAPNVRLGLQQLLTEMDEIDDEDSVLSGIKAAQQQVNEDNLSEALRILDGILPKIGDPDLLAETKRWRAEIEQRLREKQ